MAYTTLALVKASLGIPSDTTTEDTAITAAIAAGDATIDQFCGRTFETSSVTRTYLPRSSQKLDVDDLASGTVTIRTDEDQDGTYETLLVAGTDYVLVGNSTPYRVITNINRGWPLSLRGRATVQIAGTFGYNTTVPDNVKQAALLLAARLYQRKASPLGFQAGAISELGPVRISRSDPDVSALLHGVRLLPVA